jgi:hypothetical protein
MPGKHGQVIAKHDHQQDDPTGVQKGIVEPRPRKIKSGKAI